MISLDYWCDRILSHSACFVWTMNWSCINNFCFSANSSLLLYCLDNFFLINLVLRGLVTWSLISISIYKLFLYWCKILNVNTHIFNIYQIHSFPVSFWTPTSLRPYRSDYLTSFYYSLSVGGTYSNGTTLFSPNYLFLPKKSEF